MQLDVQSLSHLAVREKAQVFPKRVCAATRGLMRDEELRMLVEMGINTFVCLQTSYVEYGVRLPPCPPCHTAVFGQRT